jgi:hypothetical protein
MERPNAAETGQRAFAPNRCNSEGIRSRRGAHRPASEKTDVFRLRSNSRWLMRHSNRNFPLAFGGPLAGSESARRSSR